MKILNIYAYLEGPKTDVVPMLNEELKDKYGGSLDKNWYDNPPKHDCTKYYKIASI